MKKTSSQLKREIAAALRKPLRSGHARKLKPKSRHEILKDRLETLRSRMEDALGDVAWRDTDLYEIEKWINVDEELSNREWLEAAQKQLLDQSVLPEHAGAPPPNVYAWNDVFISAYRMNIDDGMNREEAIDSARQNAFDTVKLSTNELSMIKIPSSTRRRRSHARLDRLGNDVARRHRAGWGQNVPGYATARVLVTAKSQQSAV